MQTNEIEIDDPPMFEIGEKVRSRKLIRNDGTFPGKDIGATLAKKGDVGYVVSIGTFLQSSYIYAVHFMTTGYVVGCRSKELEFAEDINHMKVMLRHNSAGHLVVYVAKKDLEEEVVKQVEADSEKILTLANGWELAISRSEEPLKLPKTVEARRLA